ncbi:MAG: hypothetical protein KGL39_38330 [Patescibacteria group bacterium]|nr:hypothetical protein [Patescibacteria group bacterium]
MIEGEKGWYLDRKVPVSIIAAIIFQTFGVIIWATRVDSRVSVLETQNTTQDIRLQRVEDLTSRVAVMESHQNDIVRRLDIQTKTMQEILSIVSQVSNTTNKK